MEQKLLIGGSILAVVVLVLAGISPVIGFNSVKSSLRDSPLFSIRTQRAINEETMKVTGEYVGQGELIPIPSRDDTSVLVQRITDILVLTNEKEFNKIISSVIHYVEKSETIDIGMIIGMLYLIRTKPEIIRGYTNNDYESTPELYVTIDPWYPGCLIFSLIYYLLVMITLNILWYILIFLFGAPTCDSSIWGCYTY